MVEHTRSEAEEANFYPVDGIRGDCKCGHYFHYIVSEGEAQCEKCGRVYNVYVDHDIWSGPTES